MNSNLYLSLCAILNGAWRRRALIITPLLIMPLLATLIGIFTPKQYQSYTTLLIQETSKLNPFLEDLSVSTNLKDRFAALDSLLHSRYVLQMVIDDANLLPKNASQSDYDNKINLLSSSVTLNLVGSDLVQLRFKTQSPENSAIILQAISQRFLDNVLAPEQSSISGSEKFLKEQITKQEAELNKAEKNLADFKRRQAAELPDLYSSNVNRLHTLKDKQEERLTQLAGAKAALHALQNGISQVNPIIANLEQQIVNTTNEISLLRTRYTDSHSKIQAAIYRLKQLEDERQSQLNSIPKIDSSDLNQLLNLSQNNNKSNTSQTNKNDTLLDSQLKELQKAATNVKSLQEELNSIDRMLSEASNSVGSFGDVERQMSELERNLQVQREIYQDLLTRYKKAQVTGALGQFEKGDRVKVIDPPFTPTSPSTPPLFVFVIAGIITGIAIGCGFALIAEITDSTVHRSDKLSMLLGVPILIRIPYNQEIEQYENRPAQDNTNHSALSAGWY
ncbi:MAG: GumC family protein [Plesiomonas sp.]|uniref:GumC family protein n=1 Tax=Plesiomonas sp. TaxID=2486279 RepID=UPI003F2C263C